MVFLETPRSALTQQRPDLEPLWSSHRSHARFVATLITLRLHACRDAYAISLPAVRLGQDNIGLLRSRLSSSRLAASQFAGWTGNHDATPRPRPLSGSCPSSSSFCTVHFWVCSCARSCRESSWECRGICTHLHSNIGKFIVREFIVAPS